ncbi:hypothetical protein BJQ89_00731 [Arthrobacter sp. ES1]|nr:hypothetical protein [Arthrobacter sp. ES1]
MDEADTSRDAGAEEPVELKDTPLMGCAGIDPAGSSGLFPGCRTAETTSAGDYVALGTLKCVSLASWPSSSAQDFSVSITVSALVGYRVAASM